MCLTDRKAKKNSPYPLSHSPHLHPSPQLAQLAAQQLGASLLQCVLSDDCSFGFVQLDSVAAAQAAVEWIGRTSIDGVALVAERTVALTPGRNPKLMEPPAACAELVLKNLPFDCTAERLKQELVRRPGARSTAKGPPSNPHTFLPHRRAWDLTATKSSFGWTSTAARQAPPTLPTRPPPWPSRPATRSPACV